MTGWKSLPSEESSALVPRNEVDVGRNLLKQVAFACAAQLHHVERDHAQQANVARPLAQRRRFEADAAEQKVLPSRARGLAP